MQTPPPWPNAPLSYATAQLLSEFSFADPQAIVAVVKEAAGMVPPIEGSVLLMRRAREILRQRL